jgi:hypothetical protein
MSNAARWRDWKPSGSTAKTDVGSAAKPSKPSKPPEQLGPTSATPGSNLAPIRPPAPPPPATLDVLAGLAAEVATFAQIGSAAPASGGADGSPSVGFEGFEGFVADTKRKNILQARVGSTGSVVLRPADPSEFPEPTGFKTVASGVGADEVRYTVVQHHIKGPNHVGQDGAEFLFCLVNLAAWRRGPVDLRLVNWFRSEQDAMSRYLPSAPPPPEPSACSAMFAGGVQVELRRENRSRWQMWEVRSGRRTRRTDFSSPYCDHAKRTAIFWYGEPLTEWLELQEKPSRPKGPTEVMEKSLWT